MPHAVRYELGYAEFAPGDNIAIQQVRGTSDTIATGGTHSVEGTSVEPSANLDARYTKDGLINAIQAAARNAGVQVCKRKGSQVRTGRFLALPFATANRKAIQPICVVWLARIGMLDLAGPVAIIRSTAWFPNY